MNAAQIDRSTPYTAIDVAKAFLERAQNDEDAVRDISNMKLNKLVYFAQVVCLVLYGKTIHNSNTFAWDFGPVAPVLYRTVKKIGNTIFGLEDFEKVCGDTRVVDDPKCVSAIDETWKRMKSLTAVQLSMLTHMRGTPWEIVYNADRYGIISPELMKEKNFGDRR